MQILASGEVTCQLNNIGVRDQKKVLSDFLSRTLSFLKIIQRANLK